MTFQRPTFLYDGDCAFCSTCARFVERWIPTTAQVVAWQFADLDALGVTAQQAEDAVQWVGVDGQVDSGPVGIAALLRDAGSYWSALGFLLGLRPVLWLAWPVYRLIARHRDKLPGGTETCALPQAQREQRRREG